MLESLEKGSQGGVDTFIELSRRIGRERVLWWCDPIVKPMLFTGDYYVSQLNGLQLPSTGEILALESIRAVILGLSLTLRTAEAGGFLGTKTSLALSLTGIPGQGQELHNN